MKIKVVFLLLITAFQSCSAQQHRPIKVENHLKGALDYTYQTLELVQKKVNGEEIFLGKINTDGTLHFNLPEYDIRALFDSINLAPNKLQQWFLIDSDCKGKDAFAKTPFDDVYSAKSNGLFIRNYGIQVAVLEAATEMENETSTYFWFYIDRGISFKETCNKVNSRTGDIYATVNVDIKFEKGWNLIEERKSKTSSDTQQPQKIKFIKSSPSDKKVKWSLRQIQEDQKIETAKRLFNLTPIPKEQFEKWAPNKLGDLTVRTKEHGNPPRGQKNKNNIHLIYVDDGRQKEIDLYVIDAAKNPNDMEMINFAYAMENNGKEEKDIKPYITQYNEQTKATQLLYKVENRILIIASGIHLNGEELWEYIQKLKVEKLL